MREGAVGEVDAVELSLANFTESAYGQGVMRRCLFRCRVACEIFST